MSKINIEVSTEIPAPPEHIYRIIADYHTGHRAILPRKYFEEMTILEGGLGAGTHLKVRMNVFGTRHIYRLEITEPDPGRILVEADKEAGVTTTFTVDPLEGRGATRVTIHTDVHTQPGLKGLLERWFNPAIMRRIYQEELDLLKEYVVESLEPVESAP